MQVVDSWTGRHANALRRALRLTNEGLAEQLGTAVRTVAKWNADPDLVPVPEMQRALDTMLSQAPEDAQPPIGCRPARQSTRSRPSRATVSGSRSSAWSTHASAAAALLPPPAWSTGIWEFIKFGV
jgi:hypothetical protein